MTAAEFRAAYPEFTSATTYTDGAILAWLGTAEKLVSPDRWGELRDRAVGLCAAHYLKIANDNLTGPGSGGVVSAEKVGSIAVSYDTAGLEQNAGQWNQTGYGRQFISLSRLIGSGGLYLQ